MSTIMPKNTSKKKKKNWGKFWSGNRFLNWNKINYPYFSIYCQSSTQTTKVKPNQKVFDRTNSNLTSFFIKKLFQWIWKLKIPSFMTKVNPNNINETKSDIFPLAYSNLIPYLFFQKILKHFNDFQNQNFSVLWLKPTQKVEKNKSRHFEIWHHFSPVANAKIFEWPLQLTCFNFIPKVSTISKVQ